MLEETQDVSNQHLFCHSCRHLGRPSCIKFSSTPALQPRCRVHESFVIRFCVESATLWLRRISNHFGPKSHLVQHLRTKGPNCTFVQNVYGKCLSCAKTSNPSYHVSAPKNLDRPCFTRVNLNRSGSPSTSHERKALQFAADNFDDTSFAMEIGNKMQLP